MNLNHEAFYRDLARLIDHTLLKPEATADQISQLCQEALDYNFCSVCVNPYWVPLATKILKGNLIKIATVIGFPLGATTTTTKLGEARGALAGGASELDMVINIGALKSGLNEEVQEDIAAVVKIAADRALVKVILETGLLTEAEKIQACRLAMAAGAHFVKTATGFGPGGATGADIALMRQTVGNKLGVKAAGGIRDLQTALNLIKAGANRLGTSSGLAIINEARQQNSPKN